jgi:tRNA threonylcarbamoyladenosine biosynthesis protein TsaB
MKTMQNMLAIDSSSDCCSVALKTQTGTAELRVDEPREHSRKLLPMIDELLRCGELHPRDLDLLVFCQGPGSFTGLRIGVSVAQGLAYGLGLPTLGISSLSCQANAAIRLCQAGEGDHILSLLDARMDEVCWAEFKVIDGVPRILSGEGVCRPGQLADDFVPSSNFVGVGSGWRYREQIDSNITASMIRIEASTGPCAIDLLQLVPTVLADQGSLPAEAAKPVYIREEISWKKQDRSL